MTRAQFGTLATMLMVAALAAGCGRSEVRLAGPGEALAAVPGTGRVVVIRSVKDERVFEQAPRDPSTPSLGGDGAAQASAETKARAIARKRNAYGMAAGDILLEPGNTVESTVRDNLAAALNQAGFQVRDARAAGASPLMVDVRIRKFWSWMTPGALQMTVEAVIETDITPAGGATIPINVRAKDSSMMLTEAVWIAMIDKGLQDWRAQVASNTTGWR